MGKKFFLVFEEVNIDIENAHIKDLYNGPGLYIVNSAGLRSLVYIPEDVRESPQYITIDSKELESITNKESKKEGIVENFTSGYSESKKESTKIESPKGEWVSAETLVKVVELLAKK